MSALKRIIKDVGFKEAIKTIIMNKDAIFETYKNRYFGEKDIKDLAVIRLSICELCDKKKGTQENINSWYCPDGMGCSCSLKTKVYNFNSRCKIGNWDNINLIPLEKC